MLTPLLCALLDAARPKTLTAVLIPIAIATTLCIRTAEVDLAILVVIFLYGLTVQIATNFSNDYFDFLKGADREDRVGPKRVMQQGLMSLRQMKFAIVASITFALIFGSILIAKGGIVILLLVLASAALAILYTGGPYPLAYLGLGEIFVFSFFGPIATGMSYYLLTDRYSTLAFLVGISPGLISAAILVVNNIRDFESDKRCGKNTLVVRFGKVFGKVEYVSLLILAAAFPIALHLGGYEMHHSPVSSAFILPALPTLKIVISSQEGSQVAKALVGTSKLLLLFGVLFCVGYLN